MKLGRRNNCSDCEFILLDAYHVAMMNDKSKCISVDYQANHDVSIYIKPKQIFTSSTMDGLFSETCIDAQTFERFKKKEID